MSNLEKEIMKKYDVGQSTANLMIEAVDFMYNIAISEHGNGATSLPVGKWVTGELTGRIFCDQCGHDALDHPVKFAQHKSMWCPSCGARMLNGIAEEFDSTVNLEAYKATVKEQ